MPVFDQGYRRFMGGKKGRVFRWWPISVGCLRTSFRWPLITLLVIGAIPLAFHLFQAYASAIREGFLARVVNPWGFGDGLFFETLSQEIFFVVLAMMIVGSGQIAEDLRTGALEIYFSKPITWFDYLLGKFGTVLATGLMLTLLPGLILLVGATAFAPDLGFLTDNPLLPLKILAFSLLVSVVLGSLVLAFSSLGRRGRMVGVAFAGSYFFTMVLSRVLTGIFEDARWEAVHIGKCLDAAGRTIFEDGPSVSAPPELAWGVLVSLTLFSFVLLTRRVNPGETAS